MNAVEFPNTVHQAEDVQPTAIEESQAQRQPASDARSHPRLRHALLVSIALFSAWLFFTISSSISELEAEVDMIHANLVTSPQPTPTHSAD